MKAHKKPPVGPLVDGGPGKGDSTDTALVSNQDRLDALKGDTGSDQEEDEELLSTDTGGGKTLLTDDSDDDDGSDDDSGDGKEAKGSGKGSDGTEGDDVDLSEDSEEEVDLSGDSGKTGEETEEEEGDGDEVSSESEDHSGMGDTSGDDDTGAPEVPAVDLPVIPAPVTPTSVTFGADLSGLSDEDIGQWIAQTGMSPADHAAVIQERADELVGLATQQGTVVHAAKDGLLAEADGVIATATTTVDTAVQTGTARVTGAFGSTLTAVVTAANEGIDTVAKDKEKGAGLIEGVATSRKEEVSGVLSTAQTDVDGVIEQGATEYEGLLQTGAEDLRAFGETEKTRATDKGKELAGALNEKVEGDGALDIECEKTSLGEIAAGAGNTVDTKIATATLSLDAQARLIADNAVETETRPLSEETENKRIAAEGNIETGKQTALGKLDAGAETATSSLEGTRDTAEERVQGEEERAIERLEVAATALRDNTAAAGEELKATIEAKATADANSYAAVSEDLQATLDAIEGPASSASLEPTLAAVEETLASSHELHLEELETLEGNGLDEFETTTGDLLDVFDGAVEDQEGEAQTLKETMLAEVTASVTEFSGSLQGMADTFDATLTENAAPVAEAAGKIKQGAEEAITLYKDSVKTKFDAVKTELTTAVDEVLGTISEKAKTAGKEKANAKRVAFATKDVPTLFDCMEGMGTDESGIYDVLRAKTWGEIEALEATWNKLKSETLRWYLRDEMSGSELDTALAYLDHDRAKALKLELEDSSGFWNDDEARIEKVLRSASQEEMETLTTQYASTIEDTKDVLGGADLDTFNALTDTSLSREESHSKASAIRLFDAMDGMGTDEAKVKEILEGAATPEERERLRSYYSEYAQSEGESGNLEADIEGDFSGAEENLMLVLAKQDRDPAEVMAAKVYEAGSGGGTDEKGIFKALKSPEMAQLNDQLTSLQGALNQPGLDDTQREILEAQIAEVKAKQKQHTDAVDAHMRDMTGQGMEAYLATEMEDLELEIATETFKNGKADPEDLLEYASTGMGTDEEMVKEALTDADGNPLSKEEIARIDADLQATHGYSLQDLADGELGGKDFHDVSKLMLGKPETPQDMQQLVEMDQEYHTSGWGGAMVWIGEGLGTHRSGIEADFAVDNWNETMGEIESAGLDNTSLEEIKQSHPELAHELDLQFANVSSSLESYSKACDAATDTLISVLEVIGGVIATIATAGAASPVLAALIANICIGTAGIVLKKLAKGDRYALEDMGIDFVKMASTAALGAGLSKVKVFGKIAESAGKSGTELFNQAGKRAGMLFGNGGWTMGPTGQAYLNTFITKGTENVMTGGITDFYGNLWNEKNFDAGVDDWIFGAAEATAGNVHTNFLSGGASGMYGKYVSDAKTAKFKDQLRAQNPGMSDVELEEMMAGIDPKYMTHGSMTADMMYGMRDKVAGSVIGHVTNSSNYADAGKFWDGLASGAASSIWKGALDAYGSRKALVKEIGLDLDSGALDPSVYGQIAGNLSDEEKLDIGERVPMSRLPPDIKTLVVKSSEDALHTDLMNADGITATSVLDPSKVQNASPVVLGQALHGGTVSWSDIAGREFTPNEKLLLARYAAGSGKLPADFLGDDCADALRAMPPDTRVALLVDVGWEDVPQSLKDVALGAVETESNSQGFGQTVQDLWQGAMSPAAISTTLQRYKGAALPPDLAARIGTEVDGMTDSQRVSLASSLKLDELDQLPTQVAQQLTDSVIRTVQTDLTKANGEQVMFALTSGQLDPSQIDLGEASLTLAQRSDLVKAAFSGGHFDALPADTQTDLNDMYRSMGSTDKIPLLAELTRTGKDIPPDARTNLAREIRNYEVAVGFGVYAGVSEDDLTRLKTLAGSAP